MPAHAWTVLLLVMTNSGALAVKLQCNQSLSAGTMLRLTEKLDLSGKDPSHGPSIRDACAIVGPTAGPPATIMMPDGDCALHALGEVTLAGHLHFVAGNAQDCCFDGEGHGSILCSESNMTIAPKAHVTVEATDAKTIINPGGFWTAKYISVHGSVNATLAAGQMTGVNGLLSSSGVRVSRTGMVVASGMKVARGAAIQGGDFGTVIHGAVICSSYEAIDAGGCIAGGQNTTLGPSGTIYASDAKAVEAGGVVNGGHLFTVEGRIVARNLHSTAAGAVLTGDNINMTGNSSIDAYHLYGAGGPSAIATKALIMSDNARIKAKDGWGADSGFIGVNYFEMRDNTALHCENSYADNCGGCVLADMNVGGNAYIVARNMSARGLAGALCGGYPHQNLTVSGTATIDIEKSTGGLYGGALLAHTLTFTGGAFRVRLHDTEAACGGAIVALSSDGHPGEGSVVVDASGGGTLLIENARERNVSLGCLSVEANLQGGAPSPPPAPPVPIIQQPCSDCMAKDFPVARRSECLCSSQKVAGFRECCTSF